jgi:RES domain
VPVVEVSVLSGPFLNLTSMYSPVDSDNTNFNLMDVLEAGDLLDQLIQDDWVIFSDRLAGPTSQMDLLEAILSARYTNVEWARRQEAQEYPFDRFELYTSRRNPVDFTMADAWEEHRQKLIESGDPIDPFGLSPDSMSKAASTLTAGTVIYRARNGYNLIKVNKYFSKKEPYRGSEIGAPSASDMRPGRANRAGQVALYAADQGTTAVAEVRPARGFLVTVGEWRTKRDLRLLDLFKERPAINPFTDTILADTVELYSLFDAFSLDLSTPLDRGDDLTAYLPSQNLTDGVRAAGYDGIRYLSAMHPEGSNIVLFDPAVVEYVDSKLVTVTEVDVEFEPADSP